MRWSLIALTTLIGCAVAAAGCGGSQLQEMQNQVNAQQAQIEKQARELAELRAQQNVATTLPPSGSCDDEVMHKALAHGDDQYAAGQYSLALGYYQDAAVACPGNSQVETSLGRAYAKLGDSQESARHYQKARDAAATTP
jgi:Flp pilus assembly protein TadD